MFDKGIHKRIKIVLLIVIFIFLLVIGKVFYIEVIEYKKLNTLASGLWSRNFPIEADRGKIYTVDGEIVAGNLTTTSLVFIPNQINSQLWGGGSLGKARSPLPFFLPSVSLLLYSHAH